MNKKIIGIGILFIYILSIILIKKETMIPYLNSIIGKIFSIVVIIFLLKLNILYGFVAMILLIFLYKIYDINDSFHISKKQVFQYDRSIAKQPPKYTAVIVEPREHKALEFVLKNFMDNLDEKWGFVILHGTKNERYLKNIIDNSLGKYKSRITLVNLGVENLSVADYSMMFYDEDFYSYIPSEMFLVFQTDSIILKENRDKIYDFMEYDYVGAPWKKNFGILGKMSVGNGGLSLRRKSKMLELLKYKNRAINNGKYSSVKYGKYYAEDWFFNGYFCPELKIKKPNFENAKEFSIEAIYYGNSFGVHKPWSGLTRDEMNLLINKYPDINELMILNDYK